ncbi:hypothetical protein VTN49DRAFT_5237 [Thermomyces lanuginosus]|uniref:uncharacterized protein n=1 Tax=Thermomyces lanuginosus TaxID=5541 RepID=UPI0037434631
MDSRGLYKRVYATPTAISSASHNNSVFFGFSSSKVLHHSRPQLSTRSFEPILQSSKMKFAGVMLALAVAATAAPSGKEAHNSPQEPFWPVKHDVTVEEVKTVCGEENQVLCCNEVSYVDESHDKVIGPLAGALGNLLGGKNGAKGLGLFDQCSHLNLNALGGVSELIHSQCKTNIACCNGNKASAVSRSILMVPSSASQFLALPLVHFFKLFLVVALFYQLLSLPTGMSSQVICQTRC